MLRKAGNELIQTAPPVGITLTSIIFGLTLQQWVYALTIVYTLLQIVRILPKVIRAYRPLIGDEDQ